MKKGVLTSDFCSVPTDRWLPAPASQVLGWQGTETEARAQQTICSGHSLSGLSLACPSRYSPRSPALQSETVHYKRGVSQQFSLPSFKIDFSEWKDDEVTWPPSPALSRAPSDRHRPVCSRSSSG